MILALSNDGMEWFLDFGPDSVNLTVEDLVRERKMHSQEFSLPAWRLLLSQRQDFVNSNYCQPTKKQEIRDEIIPKGSPQHMDTSRYQVSDLDDLELYWKNDQLQVDVAFRSRIDTSFSPTVVDDLETGGSAENPKPLDGEEDKENPPPTTSVCERPTRPPALLRIGPFGT